MFQVAIGVGIVIATLVGATEVVDWRVAIGAAAVPAVMMLLAMLRMPESRGGSTSRTAPTTPRPPSSASAPAAWTSSPRSR